MENKKNIKNITLGLICLSVLVLIGLSVYQHFLLKNLSPTEISETVENEDTAGNAPSEPGVIAQQSARKNTSSPAARVKQPDISDIDELEDKLMTTEEELDAVYRQIADESARKKELEQKQMELQKQYLNDPAMKSSLKSYLDTAYADLFKELNLSAEELDKFKDILVNGQMTLSEISFEISSATTKEQKADLQKRIAEAREKNEAEIKDFLGTDYNIYHDYTEMATTRSVINGFKASLSADNQLTEAQEKELTQIMYKEQMQVFSEIGYDPRKEIEFDSDVKSGEVDGQLKNMEKIHTRSIANSKGVLSASQLQKYEEYLKSQRELQEMYSKLSE